MSAEHGGVDTLLATMQLLCREYDPPEARGAAKSVDSWPDDSVAELACPPLNSRQQLVHIHRQPQRAVSVCFSHRVVFLLDLLAPRCIADVRLRRKSQV